MAAVGLQKNIYMKKHIRKQDDATYQDLEQCGANEAQHRLDMTSATYRAQKEAATWRRKGFSVFIHSCSPGRDITHRDSISFLL